MVMMADNSISDDDKALFRQMIQGVKPLDKIKTIEPFKEPVNLPPPRQNANIDAPKIDRYLSNHYQTNVGIDSILSYCQTSIPKKRFIQLKRGEIILEARLDLHGYKPDDAREILCDFLERQQQLAHRCVLVIHGKGSRNGEAPILKNLVHHWLPQVPMVMAYHSALPRDGGTGAVYVLIQRYRQDNY